MILPLKVLIDLALAIVKIPLAFSCAVPLPEITIFWLILRLPVTLSVIAPALVMPLIPVTVLIAKFAWLVKAMEFTPLAATVPILLFALVSVIVWAPTKSKFVAAMAPVWVIVPVELIVKALREVAPANAWLPLPEYVINAWLAPVILLKLIALLIAPFAVESKERSAPKVTAPV